MTQTIEYVVKVDANQAKASIADVEKRFGNVTKGAKDMASKLGPAAAAISSVSASLGAAGGQAGKFVAAGGQIVAAFGAGGPVGAAIVAGTVAVDALSASWIKATAAQDAALDSMFASVNKQLAATRVTKAALEETRTALTSALRIGETEGVTFERSLENLRKQGATNVKDASDRLDKLKATALDLKKIEKEAADLDMTFQQARMWRTDLREKEIASAERALANVQAQATLAPMVLVVEKKRLETAEKKAAAEERFKAALEGQRSAYAALFKFKETTDFSFDEFSSDTNEITRTMRGQVAVAGGGGLGGALANTEGRALEQSSQDWLDKMRQEAVAHRHENLKTAAEKELETKKHYNELEVKHKKDTADAILAIDQTYANSAIEVATGTFSTMLSVGQGYIDAKIRGEEDAEQKAVASFLSATGQQLVASGTRALFEGAMISLNPLTPGLGTPLMIAGGASIAAGLAMGAGGSAVASSIPASGAGGGSGSRDPGASPRSSGGSGGGGPMIINVSYGAGGPLPEDIAREIHKVTSSGNRRSGR